ncbi:MAG: alpha-L-arabinofuranosidase C-terminal domain-containing protein [Phycisphaerae bacterium]
MNRLKFCVAAALAACTLASASVTITVDSKSKPISDELMGIFFEDLNQAADGGLYAELIENRSFEFTPLDNPSWTYFTGWEEERRGGARGSFVLCDMIPIHPNNPRYLVWDVADAGAGCGLSNDGFDGVSLKAGEKYDFSVWTYQLHSTGRWNGDRGIRPMPMSVVLETADGEEVARGEFSVSGHKWVKHEIELVPSKDAPAGKLVLLAHDRGGIATDMVSLFPRDTFGGHKNGLRKDLAQTIADLHPKFMRFPGGCLAHGNGIYNFYDWKDTVGPVEQRKGQFNIWGYHQSVGLGYYEYFQFCEDMGAEPLPVVPAGVSCQHSGHMGGVGQQCVPMEDMPAFIQDLLDLVEWANGPADSKWGAVRAAAGHPEPFNLKYLGVGNEDAITEGFKERYKMINDAFKEKHPEIIVCGTTGPATGGEDYELGWAFAKKEKLPMVDEHGYMSPEWFWQNLTRFDAYERTGTKVYLGEYAAHDTGRANTLRSALAEAAYLTALERNGDLVVLSSYAPLLSKERRTQWRPDLIYFDNHTVTPSINYYVQQLFSLHCGDSYLPTTLEQKREAGDAPANGILLGTWDTQAVFDDVEVSVDGRKLFADNLSNASKWEPVSGDWSIVDGAYSQTSNAQAALAYHEITSAGDCVVNLRAKKTGGREGFLIGFGAIDSDTYYRINLGGWGNAHHQLQRMTGQTGVNIGPEVRGSIETGKWYDIKVQKSGDRIRCWLDGKQIVDFTDRDGFRARETLAASTVRDSKTGDVILKIVSRETKPVTAKIDISAIGYISSTAARTVLAGDEMAVNRFGRESAVLPAKSEVKAGAIFDYEIAPHSLTVLRFKTK